MAGIDRVMQILSANKDKTFVKRILSPDRFPKLAQEDGSHATHKMAWGETGGENGEPVRYVVYPTVLYDGKALKDYGDSAFEHVMKSGNFIEFDNPNDADWFSRNYKLAWRGARGGG